MKRIGTADRQSEEARAMDVSDWIRLWALRLLAHKDAISFLVKKDTLADEDVGRLLGLGKWVDASWKEYDPQQVTCEIKTLLADYEKRAGRAKFPAALKDGLNRFGRVLGLSTDEKLVLLVLVLREWEPDFGDALRLLRRQTVREYQNNLARMLQIPQRRVQSALGKDGKLLQSCILQWLNGRGGTGWSPNFIDDNFAEKLMDNNFSLSAVIRSIAPPAPAPTLALGDFEHARKNIDYLLAYLREIVRSGRAGVNIFIHGQPGTGKSELVRLVAKVLKCQLHEVGFEDDERDAVDGEGRLKALRAAQMMIGRQRSLLVFDEAEDVFGQESLLRRSLAQSRKAWINRMLETNPVPTFWISNSLDGLDRAFARRFDLVFELTTPPLDQRLKVFRRTMALDVSDTLLKRLCLSDQLTPAVVARAAGVVREIRKSSPAVEVDGAVEHLVTQTMKAQGHGTRKLTEKCGGLPAVYDICLLNCDTPLESLAAEMDAGSSCRICLYGAPGTGKTSFGHWLAERLQVPIHAVRASDILGPYVGESERRLARAFAAAREAGAILMLDEVDTFLQDRRQAHRSWEVSLVNEMLTQMEHFSGIFIASTNLMDGIDEASLRRFDLKLKFNYISARQAHALLKSHCLDLGIASPLPADLEQLANLDNLTPGDFANVARQHRFRKFTGASGFVGALATECATKDKQHVRKVGFA